jgi:hypothetical protein
VAGILYLAFVPNILAGDPNAPISQVGQVLFTEGVLPEYAWGVR